MCVNLCHPRAPTSVTPEIPFSLGVTARAALLEPHPVKVKSLTRHLPIDLGGRAGGQDGRGGATAARGGGEGGEANGVSGQGTADVRPCSS